jgi:hypothetical protein
MLPSPIWFQRVQKPFEGTASLRIEVNSEITCVEKADLGNFEARRDFREVGLAFATMHEDWS